MTRPGGMGVITPPKTDAMLLVSDSFDRADNTSPGSADTGQAWTELFGGSWGIVSNLMRQRANAAGTGERTSGLSIDTGQVIVDIEVTVTTAQSGNVSGAGIMFRVQNQSNNFQLAFNKSSGGLEQLYLQKQIAGVYTTLLGPITSTGNIGTLRVVDDGSVIKIFLNGVFKGYVVDATLNTYTTQGLWMIYSSTLGANDGTGWRFNNYSVNRIDTSVINPILTDDFNRASLGSDWGGSSPTAAMTIVSNEIVTNNNTNGGSNRYVGGVTVPSAVAAEITVTSLVNTIGRVMVRHTSNDNWSGIQCSISGSTVTLEFYKRVGGTFTKMATDYTATVTLPFKIRCVAIGTDRYEQIDTGSGFVTVRTGTDTNNTTGTIGILGLSLSGGAFFKADNLKMYIATELVTHLDDFNRVTSSNLGSDWVETGASGIGIVNPGSDGRMEGSGVSASWAWWNYAMGSDNNYIEFDIDSTSAGTNSFFIRSSVKTEVGPHYECYWYSTSGGSFDIRKRVGGVSTVIKTQSGVGTLAGKRIRFEVIGTTLKIYVDGVVKVTHTDSAVTTGQYVGVRLDNSSEKINNFEAGPI